MRYKDADIGFEVPQDWENRSITIFAVPKTPEQKLAPNVVVTREVSTSEESLEDYANQQLIDAAQRLESFKLRKRSVTVVGGLPGIEVSFSWGPGGAVRQRQVFVQHKKKMVSIVFTVLEAEYSAFERHFEKVLSTVHFS